MRDLISYPYFVVWCVENDGSIHPRKRLSEFSQGVFLLFAITTEYLNFVIVILQRLIHLFFSFHLITVQISSLAL
jgi:hypothetical protein